MCTWAVSAVIDHYNRQGPVVYGCAMGLSKAFDLVEWVTLLKTLQGRNVSPVFLRTILFTIYYTTLPCDVKWNGSYSHRFPVTNGVRQGRSALLLCSVSTLMSCSALSEDLHLAVESRTASLPALVMQMICYFFQLADLDSSQWLRSVKNEVQEPKVLH
jgi:hypothetical protein